MPIDNLKPDRGPGDFITAEQYNILVDAVKRTLTGPNVVETPGGWHITGRAEMNDRPVVLIKKPKASDTTLIVRHIRYIGRAAAEGRYEWASKDPIIGAPEFGFKVVEYLQFYWKAPTSPPPDQPVGQPFDPVPDADASFLYARFINGHWIVGHPPTIGMGFAVIVDAFLADGTSKVLIVREVIADPEQIGQFIFLGTDVQTVNCWPGFSSRHYGAFVWAGTSIAPETQILPILQIGGDWYAQALYRIPSMIIPQGLNYTDCQVIPEPSP